MRKRRSSIGKRAIVSAMTIMLTLSAPMVAFSDGVNQTKTLSDETIKNDSGIDASTFTEEPVKSSADALSDMVASTNAAEQAANDAAAALDTISSSVTTASNAATTNYEASVNGTTVTENVDAAASAADLAANGTTNGGGANGAATAAETIANDASTALTNDKKAIGDYNSAVASDQIAVNTSVGVTSVTDANGQTVSTVSTDGTITVSVNETKDDGSTQVSQANAAQYISDKSDEAQQAAEDAEKALKAALAVDTDVVTQEVKDAAADAQTAADTAQAAADDASDVYNKALEAFLNDAASYNAYATAYGTDLYDLSSYFDLNDGEVSVAEQFYLDALTAASTSVAMNSELSTKANTAVADIEVIKTKNLSSQEAVITAADQTVAASESILSQATAAANSAKSDADAAMKALADFDYEKNANGTVKIAEDGSQTVLTNEDGTPKFIDDGNKSALELTQEAQTVVDTAQKQAIADAATALEAAKTELGHKNDDLTTASTTLETAQGTWDSLNWKKKLSVAIKGSEAYNLYEAFKAAQATVDAAQAAVDEAQAAVDEAQENADNAKVVSDAVDQLVADAETDANQDIYNNFTDDVSSFVSAYNLKINQTEFDRAINEWAQEYKFSDLGDRECVRKYIFDSYCTDQTLIKKIKDIFGINALISNTKYNQEIRANMDAIENAATSAVIAKIAANEYSAKLRVAAANTLTEGYANKGLEGIKLINSNLAVINDANATVNSSRTTVALAKTKLENAQTTLNNVKKAINEAEEGTLTMSTFDLNALKTKLSKAETTLEAAKDDLAEAQAAAKTASTFAKFATALVTEQKANSFYQTNAEGGQALENVREYDQTDALVISRNSALFGKISNGNLSITVPYSVYRDYIQRLYDRETDKSKMAEKKGTGIAYNVKNNGSSTETTEDDATMEPLYWEIGSDGKLTGVYYTSTANLATGRYFIAYTFKKENDGYHFDGYLFDYTAPVIEEEGGDNGGGTFTTVDTSTTTETTAAVATPAVLGATRTITEEPAVLGATRDIAEEPAVLGAARNPLTGDNTDTTSRVVVMLAAAGAALALSIIAGKRKANN